MLIFWQAEWSSEQLKRNDKIRQLQSEVTDVKNLMRQNVGKAAVWIRVLNNNNFCLFFCLSLTHSLLYTLHFFLAELLIQRNDKIENVIDKTSELVSDSQLSIKNTAQLKKKLWWNNRKLGVVIGCLTVVGSEEEKQTKKKKKPSYV